MKKTSKEAKCFVCKKYKPKNEFNVDTSRSLGTSSKCKECHSVYINKYHKQLNQREEYLARQELNWMIRKGVVIKPDKCEECGVKKVAAHHYKGYEKENWLTVQWLCTKHHGMKHRIKPL